MDLKKEVLDLEKKVKEIQEESDLYRILKLEDRKNKRLCWCNRRTIYPKFFSPLLHAG